MDTVTDHDTNQTTSSPTDDARQQAQGAAGAAQEKLSDAAGQAKEQAANAADQAKGTVRKQIDARSTQFASQATDAAGDLRTVSEQLRSNGRDQPARAADQLADQVERAAHYLERSDGSGLLRDLEDFGRKRPWAVIAGGAAVGFAASRLLKSSSSERYHGASQSPSQGDGRSAGTTPRPTARTGGASAAGAVPSPASAPVIAGSGIAAGLGQDAPFVRDQGAAVESPVLTDPEEGVTHGAF